MQSAMTLAAVHRLMLFCHAVRAYRRLGLLLLAAIAPGAVLANVRYLAQVRRDRLPQINQWLQQPRG